MYHFILNPKVVSKVTWMNFFFIHEHLNHSTPHKTSSHNSKESFQHQINLSLHLSIKSKTTFWQRALIAMSLMFCFTAEKDIKRNQVECDKWSALKVEERKETSQKTFSGLDKEIKLAFRRRISLRGRLCVTSLCFKCWQIN